MSTKTRHHRIRKAVRQDSIHEYLLEQIISGALQPGGRVPAFAELERQFGAAERTIERAIRRLAAEGFVRIKPKVGTFVSDHPPHLWRYGLLFHDHQVPEQSFLWSRFYVALREEVERFNRANGPRQIQCYYDCNGHSDAEDYQRLLRDLAARRLAGLMFAFVPHGLEGTPVRDAPGIARAGVSADPGMFPMVGPSWPQFIDKALDRLASLGRENVAMLATPGTMAPQIEEFQAGVMRRGMRTLPFWIYPVEPYHPRWVRHAAQAMMRSSPSLTPDAMVVMDDHLAEPLADALTDMAVRVPQDLEVVSHWNFPLRYTRQLPFHLLGPDAAELLTRWLETIDRLRRGQPVAERGIVSPIFAEEWSVRQSTTSAEVSVN